MKGRRVRLTDAGVGKLKPHTDGIRGVGQRGARPRREGMEGANARGEPALPSQPDIAVLRRAAGCGHRQPLPRGGLPACSTTPALQPRPRARAPPSCPSQARSTRSSASTQTASSVTTTPCATAGLSLQIPPGRHHHHYVKARVRVHEYPDGTLALFHGPRCLGPLQRRRRAYCWRRHKSARIRCSFAVGRCRPLMLTINPRAVYRAAWSGSRR